MIYNRNYNKAGEFCKSRVKFSCLSIYAVIFLQHIVAEKYKTGYTVRNN